MHSPPAGTACPLCGGRFRASRNAVRWAQRSGVNA